MLIIPRKPRRFACTRRNGWRASPLNWPGMIAVTGGLTFSALYDTPAGPSVVLIARAAVYLQYDEKSRQAKRVLPGDAARHRATKS